MMSTNYPIQNHELTPSERNEQAPYFYAKENKRTGAHIGLIRQNDGEIIHTQKVTQTLNGAQICKDYQVPVPENKEEKRTLIKELSKENMTQEEIADVMDVSQPTVSRVLRGK